MGNKRTLYSYLFHYNSYTETWSAYHREDNESYWNGFDPKFPIIRSKNLMELIALVQKTNKIKKP